MAKKIAKKSRNVVCAIAIQDYAGARALSAVLASGKKPLMSAPRPLLNRSGIKWEGSTMTRDDIDNLSQKLRRRAEKACACKA